MRAAWQGEPCCFARHVSIELEGRRYAGLLKNLKHMTLDQIADEYPSVSRDQIEAVLDFLARAADPVFLGEPASAIVIHAHPPR